MEIQVVQLLNSEYAELVGQRDRLLLALRLANSEIHNHGAARSQGIDIAEVIRTALSEPAVQS